MVDTLLDKLDFTPQNAIDAATENAVLFMKAVSLRLTALAERNAAKMAFEVAEAETALAIRQTYRASGEKITEGAIDALVLVEDVVQLARQRLNTAEENDELLQRLVEAYRMRRDCLQIVERVAAEERRLLQNSELNAKLEETRRTLRGKFPQGA